MDILSKKSLEEILALHNAGQRKRPGEEEHRLQCACVKWFRYSYPDAVLLAVPNGGIRNKTTAAKLKGEGVLAGASDLILLQPSGKYHGLCIEMKTKTGRQSYTQKIFQRKVEANGYKYVVCRSSDDFIKEVKGYMMELR